MTNSFARIARSARGAMTDTFRGAMAGAEHLLDLFGPVGTALLVALAVILIRG